MKTIIIFEQCGQEALCFFVLDGDYSRFDGLYINQVPENAKEELDLFELNDLLYDDNTGFFKLNGLNHFPIKVALKQPEELLKVIIAGIYL
jgi:hypothetical protein